MSAARRYRDAGLDLVAAQVEGDPIPIDVLNASLDLGGLFVAASRGGEIDGFAACRMCDDFLHVMELQVAPDRGRLGLGGRLLEAAAHAAATDLHPGVTLACFRNVPWQMPFYGKHGFMEFPPSDWGPAHYRSWQAQAKFGLDMTNRAFMIRKVQRGYAVRPAIASDLLAMRRIEGEAGARFTASGMPDVAAMSWHSQFPKGLARDLCGRGSLWFAVYDEAPVGFLAAEATDGIGFIYEIDVLPEHSGRRLGAQLIAVCEAWARSQRLKALSLATFRDIPWNAPYYARMGFVEWPFDRLTPGHVDSWRHQADHLDMSKRLFMIKAFDANPGESP